MATELGTAYLQIMPSARGMKGNLAKELGGEGDAAGVAAGKGFAGKLKKIVAAAGIGAAVKKTLDFGAELQQNLGGTEAVFGNYANKLQMTAKDAYKNMGLSASDYMATANKMGSLFQGSGLSQVKALKLTENAMQRAADVASVMGIDTSMAMESIAGAAKGNFTMMDNLGVAMNATTLQAYALEKGVNFNWNTASNAEKAELAMQMFMERTSQYAENFARESEETLSGSIGAMKAAAQDLMGNLTLGQDVVPAMNNLVSSAVAAAGNLIPAIGNILSGLPSAISTGIDTLHPILMEGLSKATEAIKANFPTMLQGALQGLLNFSETIRSNAGQLVNAGLTFIKSLADGIIKNIPTFIQTVPTIISNFAGVINDNAPKVIKTAASILKSLGVGLIKAIPVLVKNLPKILKAIWDVFKAFNWLNIGRTLITGIAKGIKGAATAIVSILKGLVNVQIRAIFEKGWGVIKNVVVKAVDGIKTVITTVFNAIKSFITTAVNSWKNTITTIWNAIKAAVTTAVNAVKTVILTVFNAIKTFITNVVNSWKNIITNVWNGIKTVVTNAVNGIRTVISTVFNAINTFITNVVNGWKNIITNVWNGIKTVVTNAVNGVRTVISTVFNAIKTTISSIFNSIKNTASSIWNGIKTAISTPINAAKNTVTTIVNTIKDKVGGAFGGIAGKVWSAFNAVKEAITSPIQKARDMVGGVIDKIKGLFPLKLGKIFDLKLPHFSVSGGKFPWGVGGAGSAPSWSVSWYKKAMTEPYMFSNATLFGAGEAGDEVMYGRRALMRDISSAVDGRVTDDRTVRLLLQILDILSDISEQDKSIVLNNREFARLVNEVV